MARTIDMQFMRYLNLFSRLTRVSTTYCFPYNNALVFAVSQDMVSKAIGDNGENMRQLSAVLRKRVKVVALVKDKAGMAKFVAEVVSPVEFNNIEIQDNTVLLTAGRESKAALIGRERIRQKELEDILSKVFGIDKLVIL